MPPKCFGHTFGHHQEDALRGIYNKARRINAQRY